MNIGVGQKLLDYFRANKRNTAAIAKERLQIIVAHERVHRKSGGQLVDLQQLQLKLIEVIAEYLHIEHDQVKVELARDADRSVLELNVTLPDKVEA